MAPQDREILILESIYASRKPIHQRDIAEMVGLSLGMTNGIPKRLTEKELLKIRYIVSPKGVEATTRRSYRYFKRTVRNVVYYREALEAFAHREELQQNTSIPRGCHGILCGGILSDGGVAMADHMSISRILSET